MATYQYRCAVDGVTDVVRPIGTAQPHQLCLVCGARMVRIFAAPMLNLGLRAAVALVERTQRTRDEPAVVSGQPGARPSPPRPAVNPAWARLPRP
ncbi:MAG: zinc ribbon domain-containing protein [Pseudonocardiaceae bacterium]